MNNEHPSLFKELLWALGIVAVLAFAAWLVGGSPFQDVTNVLSGLGLCTIIYFINCILMRIGKKLDDCGYRLVPCLIGGLSYLFMLASFPLVFLIDFLRLPLH